MDTAVATTPVPTIHAIRIDIDRAEGPTSMCVSHHFEGLTCWEDANRWLQSQRWSFSGCDKHDFMVTFEDGETYSGRLDCSSNGGDCDVAGHIREFCKFHAGLAKPTHLSREQYENFLKHNASEIPSFTQFLSTYVLPTNAT